MMMKRPIYMSMAFLGLLAGCSNSNNDGTIAKVNVPPAAATFNLTDTPGYWFDTGNKIAGTRSLAIINPNQKVRFNQIVES